MGSVTGRLAALAIVAAATSMPGAFHAREIAVSIRAAQGAHAPPDDRARFVGTYTLITAEIRDGNGKWSPAPDFSSIGYITFGETGHMGMHIMPRNRPRFARRTPTGEEAQAALRGYTAFFGSFTVNHKDTFVVFHEVSQLNPTRDAEAKRFYEFTGDRLILTEPPADGAREKATSRLIWERLPNPPLSSEAKTFVGFYRLLYTDSYRQKDGKEVFHGDPVYARAGSYIIYTPTGHMMDHMRDKERLAQYAGAEPTPDEALKAFQSYTGYFGRFTTFENHSPAFVMHHQQGTTAPGAEVDATKRFYVFNGNVLRLGGPPTLNANGEMAGIHLYWERMGPVE